MRIGIVATMAGLTIAIGNGTMDRDLAICGSRVEPP